MKLIDLTRINQLIDGLLDKINEKYATKAELSSRLKGKADASHGTHLTLGTTQNNAYRGDYGNAAYQHSQAAHAPSNAQKNSDITKAEIEAKLTGTISSHTHSDIYSPTSHNHTSLTGVTSLAFAADSTDAGSISTTIDGTNTYFDFNLSDDPAQNDTWRWRFAPSGGTVFNAMTLDATSSTAAKLTVTGNVTATSFTENGTALSSKYAAASHGTHLTIGTGASNAAAGNHTHNYAGSSSAGGAAYSANALNVYGNNTVTTTATDTTANWGKYNTSVHWYTTAGQLTDQPSQYGYILNVGQSSEVHQLWMTQSSGDLRHRGGNASGWSGTWKTLLDTSNFKTHVTPSAIGAATSSSVGTLSSLKTSAKGNLVAAINELFQNANNGKQLIASAIGEPLDSNDTFSAMSTDINNLVSSFKANLKTAGATVNDTDKFKQLIDKTKNLSAGGIKIDCVSTLPGTVVENQIVIITSNVPSVKEMRDYSNSTPTSNGQIIIGVSTTKDSSSMVPYSITTNGVVLNLYLAIAKGQFNDTIDTYDGYIGRNGSWVNFSVRAHTLYANGYDAIGFTSTNNWSYSSTRIYFSNTSTSIDLKMKTYNGGWNDEYAYFKNPIDLTNVRQVRIVGSYYNNGAEHSGVGFVASNSFTIYPTWAKKVNLTNSVKEVITDVSSLKGNYYFGTVNRCDGTARNAMKITEFELIY